MPIMRRYEKNAPGFSHISFTGAGAPSVTVFSKAAALSAAAAITATRYDFICCDYTKFLLQLPTPVPKAVLQPAAAYGTT